MAETTVLEIDFGSTLENIVNIKKSIAELKKEREDLTKAINEGTVSQEESAKAMTLLDAGIRSQTKELTTLNRVIDNEIKQRKAQVGSIEANRAELARLTAEYIKLGKPTAEQTARIKALSDRLKEQEKALGDTRRNVGNYRGEIISAFTANNLLGGVIEKATKALHASKAGWAAATSGAITFQIALDALGIGLILLALAAFVAFLRKTETGLNLVSKTMTILGATFDAVIKRVEIFGKGVAFILNGEFSKGVEVLSGSFKGLGEEIRGAAAAANLLADAQEALEDAEIGFIERRAQIRAQIQDLRDIANDETKSYEERKRALEEALILQAELTGKEAEIAEERLSVAEKEFALSAQTDEDRKKFEEAKAAAFEDERQRTKEKIKLENELNALSREAAASILNSLVPALEKQKLVMEQINKEGIKLFDREQMEAEVKEATDVINSATETLKKITFDARDEIRKEEEAGGSVLDFLNIDEEKVEFSLGLASNAIDSLSDIIKTRKDNLLLALEDERQAEIDRVEDTITNEEERAAAIANINEKFNNKKINTQREFAKKQKAIETVQAIINTALAVTNALATVQPFIPAGIAAAAIAAATGAVQVGLINAKQFAEGGEVTDDGATVYNVGGKPHSQGGTKYYGEDGNVVEFERGEKVFVLKKTATDLINKYSMINQMAGGKSWRGGSVRHAALGGEVATSFDGGFVARNSLSNVQQQIAADNLATMFRNMPSPVVRVTEINKVQGSLQQAVEVSDL